MSHHGPTPDRRAVRSQANSQPSLPTRPYPLSNQPNGRAPTLPSNPQPRPPQRAPQQHARQAAAYSNPPLNYAQPPAQSQPSQYPPTPNKRSDPYTNYNGSSASPASSYPRPQRAVYDEQPPDYSPPGPHHASPHPTHRHRSQQRTNHTTHHSTRPYSPSKLKRQPHCTARTLLLATAGCLLLVAVAVWAGGWWPQGGLGGLVGMSRQSTVVKHSRSSDVAGVGSMLGLNDVGSPVHAALHTMAVQEGEEGEGAAAADAAAGQVAEAAADAAQEAANQPAAAAPKAGVEKSADAAPDAATPLVSKVDEQAAASTDKPDAPVPTPPASAADLPPAAPAPAAKADAAKGGAADKEAEVKAAAPAAKAPAKADAPAAPAAPATPATPAAADVPAAAPLSYKPNVVMTSSLFPKTDDGYPVFTAPSSPLYSNFYCIGGRGRENSQGDRSCRWQNLCYRPADNQWLFYQDPKTKGDMPVLLDHGVVVTEFPKQFLNLRSMGNPQDARYWAPTQVYEAIPAEAMVPRRVKERPDVHLLYHPHYPSNIGHVLGDDFFPLFNLQLSFNMLSNDNQLLMVRSCDDIFLPGQVRKAAACQKFMQMLTPGMSDRPFLAATQADLRQQLGMKADAELVCFENVLTGNGPWGFQQSLGKAPAWWQYHAFYLSNMGVSYNHTPKKHRITVSVKDGKRSIYNNHEMVDHLKKAFPSHEIDAIELYQLGGWKQELTYLLDTTVLITPCGGVSMSSMFLPHGSALVVVDFWDVAKNNTKGMEERLWSNLGYVRSFHYPFVEAEVVLDEEGRKRSVPQDMRDWGRVRVDVARMERIVRAAIAHVDSFMVMGQE